MTGETADEAAGEKAVGAAVDTIEPQARKATVGRLIAKDIADVRRVVDALPGPHRKALLSHWPAWARGAQTSPAGDWRVWVMMAGRGFGKTRAGAEWASELARGDKRLRVALVAASLDEGRAVMVEGKSGLLSVARPGERRRMTWRPTCGLLTFASGATAQLFSGAHPEGLRGPEHHIAWCDEIAKWPRARPAWDNLLLGLRLGDAPRALVTTTPIAGPLLPAILGEPGAVLTRGRTRDNPHLPAAFREAMERLYGGTRLGEQELEGKLLSDVEHSLWPAELFLRQRTDAVRAAALVRAVVGVDPPASAGGTCGIVVAGVDRAGRLLVVDDRSLAGGSPEGWARAVAGAARDWGAARVVVETNQGGDMVAAVMRGADAGLPVVPVRAVVGKTARAEPVAAAFERGEAWLAGRFPALEAQLAGLVAGGGYAGPGASPDRADAMVWALAALLRPHGEPRVRGM